MAIALVQSIHNCELKIQIPHPIPEVSSKQSLISDHKSQTYKTYMDGYHLIKRTVDWMIDAFPPDKDKQNSLICPIQYAYEVVLSNFPLTTLLLSSADPLIVCDESPGEVLGLRLQQAGVEIAKSKAEGNAS